LCVLCLYDENACLDIVCLKPAWIKNLF